MRLRSYRGRREGRCLSTRLITGTGLSSTDVHSARHGGIGSTTDNRVIQQRWLKPIEPCAGGRNRAGFTRGYRFLLRRDGDAPPSGSDQRRPPHFKCILAARGIWAASLPSAGRLRVHRCRDCGSAGPLGPRQARATGRRIRLCPSDHHNSGSARNTSGYTFGSYLQILARVAGPALFALMLLALRARVRR